MACLRKAGLICLVFALFLSVGVAEDDLINENSNVAVSPYGEYNESDMDIRFLEEEELPEMENIGIYEGFEIKSEDINWLEIDIEENQTWAENYIESNPDAFDGPGHNYSPGLIELLRGDDLERLNLYYSEGSFENKVRPETYYVAIVGTSADFDAYIDSDGDCQYYLNLSSSSEALSSCEGFLNEERNILYLSLSILVGLATFWALNTFLRPKLLIRKLNLKAKELEARPEENREELVLCLKALELADQGEFDQAREIYNRLD